jgi:hypothetical protein
VQFGVCMSCTGELAKHAMSEGHKAVVKFCTSQKKNGNLQKASWRAGLQFSVALVGSLAARETNRKVTTGAAVYLAAVLEYLTAELVELAGTAVHDSRCEFLSSKHL